MREPIGVYRNAKEHTINPKGKLYNLWLLEICWQIGTASLVPTLSISLIAHKN